MCRRLSITLNDNNFCEWIRWRVYAGVILIVIDSVNGYVGGITWNDKTIIVMLNGVRERYNFE